MLFVCSWKYSSVGCGPEHEVTEAVFRSRGFPYSRGQPGKTSGVKPGKTHKNHYGDEDLYIVLKIASVKCGNTDVLVWK